MISAKTSKTIDSLDKIIANLANFQKRSVEEIAEVGKVTAKKYSKGKLAKSIQVDKHTETSELDINSPFALFVENGRPGFKAKPNHALRFVINGKVLFRKSVGPSKAHPFIKPATESMKKQATKIINKHWQKVF